MKATLAWAEYDSYKRALRLEKQGKISSEFRREHYFMPPFPPGYSEYLKDKCPNGDRLTLAWNLAGSLDVLEDLLLGRYVDPIRLDQEWLRWAKREQFVALKPALEVL